MLFTNKPASEEKLGTIGFQGFVGMKKSVLPTTPVRSETKQIEVRLW